MSRTKVIVELVAGAVVVLLGSWLMAEAMDFYPFTVRDPVSVLIGWVIGIFGWMVVRRSWRKL